MGKSQPESKDIKRGPGRGQCVYHASTGWSHESKLHPKLVGLGLSMAFINTFLVRSWRQGLNSFAPTVLRAAQGARFACVRECEEKFCLWTSKVLKEWPLSL